MGWLALKLGSIWVKVGLIAAALATAAGIMLALFNRAERRGALEEREKWREAADGARKRADEVGVPKTEEDAIGALERGEL